MRFAAIDVETANSDFASICSIGVVVFENAQIVTEWYSLVDPQDYFDSLNVSIHGIDEEAVEGEPTFQEVMPRLRELTTDSIVVAHTHFDRTSIKQASNRWQLEPPNCTWLDSAMVARRAWAECAQSGYGLADVCQLIGYQFQHHHALEDAKASGQILLSAMRRTSLDLDGMLHRVRQPINYNELDFGGRIRREGNPEGPLSGEVVVFTGSLQIPRSEAADLAAGVGCNVATGVTKNTTILVVGDSDLSRLAGFEKSSKHRKAEDLIRQGASIRIIRETDFQQLVLTA